MVEAVRVIEDALVMVVMFMLMLMVVKISNALSSGLQVVATKLMECLFCHLWRRNKEQKGFDTPPIPRRTTMLRPQRA